MKKFEFISGNQELLDRIQPLWEELNKHHETVSTHFAEAFAEFTFEVRKSTLIEKSITGHLLVDIALDTKSHLEIGYCTPPIGLNLFISSFRFNKSIVYLYGAVFPFLLLGIITLLLITYVPGLSLWLGS